MSDSLEGQPPTLRCVVSHRSPEERVARHKQSSEVGRSLEQSSAGFSSLQQSSAVYQNAVCRCVQWSSARIHGGLTATAPSHGPAEGFTRSLSRREWHVAGQPTPHEPIHFPNSSPFVSLSFSHSSTSGGNEEMAGGGPLTAAPPAFAFASLAAAAPLSAVRPPVPVPVPPPAARPPWRPRPHR